MSTPRPLAPPTRPNHSFWKSNNYAPPRTFEQGASPKDAEPKPGATPPNTDQEATRH